jgi:hypothetical protein
MIDVALQNIGSVNYLSIGYGTAEETPLFYLKVLGRPAYAVMNTNGFLRLQACLARSVRRYSPHW